MDAKKWFCLKNSMQGLLSGIMVFVGVGVTLFSLTGLVVGISERDIGMTLMIILLFVTPGVALSYFGYKMIKKADAQSRIYGYVKAKNKVSINEISQKTKIENEKVVEQLVQLIAKNVIVGYINEANELVLNEYEKIKIEESRNVKIEVVKCKECGATNKVTVGMPKECEYCGTILNVPIKS